MVVMPLSVVHVVPLLKTRRIPANLGANSGTYDVLKIKVQAEISAVQFVVAAATACSAPARAPLDTPRYSRPWLGSFVAVLVSCTYFRWLK
jgi:hypothetical protein